MMHGIRRALLWAGAMFAAGGAIVGGWFGTAPAGEAPENSAAARGYRTLRETPFLPPDFSQELFDRLWEVWPAPLRQRASEATLEERRRMAFERYGLMEPPGEEGTGPALGYVDDGRGGWV